MLMESRGKQENKNMVTLQVTQNDSKKFSCLFSQKKTFEPKDLIKELYSNFLKDDPLFHFFFEPDLIIRISSNEVLEKIKASLKQKHIEFLVYAYPVPAPNADRYCYGENEGGPVMENLDLYLTIFHAHAIAALTLSPDRHEIYMERVNHTMCNMAGYSRHAEAEKLVELAELKAVKPLSLSRLYTT